MQQYASDSYASGFSGYVKSRGRSISDLPGGYSAPRIKVRSLSPGVIASCSPSSSLSSESTVITISVLGVSGDVSGRDDVLGEQGAGAVNTEL